jgi:Carboxypeptidase regulatory-like domain
MRILLAAILATLTFTVEAQTFRVSGMVVDSETGGPLSRTRVALSGEPAGEWSVITAADGRFQFDVPQGKYSLTAAHRDWGDVYGEPIPGSDSGAAVIAGPDYDNTQLLFRFRAPIAVYGKIADGSGEPIPSATVEMFHQVVVRGRKRLNSLGRAESDDFGNYSFSWLPAGTYYLAATGGPWYLSGQFASYQDLAQSGVPPAPYAAVYFPGSADPSGAAPVVLRPGTEFRADFVLRPAAGANLFPKCSGTEGCGYGGGGFTLYAIGPGRAQTLIRPCDYNCEEFIAAVPAGRYILRYNGVTKWRGR